MKLNKDTQTLFDNLMSVETSKEILTKFKGSEIYKRIKELCAKSKSPQGIFLSLAAGGIEIPNEERVLGTVTLVTALCDDPEGFGFTDPETVDDTVSFICLFIEGNPIATLKKIQAERQQPEQ